MSSFRFRPKSGMTLLEVIVSAVILMLVLAEMLGGFAGGRLLSRKSRDRLLALNFCRERLEELMRAGYLGLIPGEYTDTISDEDFKRRTSAWGGVWRIYRIEDVPSGAAPDKVYYRKITVVVKWRFLRNDVTYTEALSSLVYNPGYIP